MARPPDFPTVEEALWSRVRRDPEGCWEWQGPTGTNNGYGKTTFAGQYGLAHRVAWEVTHGEIPDGMKVLHRCDNPLCCRPDHLWLGTQADNVRDREQKKRRRNLHGEEIGTSKLTEADVRQMRCWREEGVTLRELAAWFGCSAGAVSHICRRESWAHVS